MHKIKEAAADCGGEHGINVIDGGWPCVLAPAGDFGYDAMRVGLSPTGNLPQEV